MQYSFSERGFQKEFIIKKKLIKIKAHLQFVFNHKAVLGNVNYCSFSCLLNVVASFCYLLFFFFHADEFCGKICMS